MLHTRLSKHFILFDFLSDIDVRKRPLTAVKAIERRLDEYINEGHYLCRELLEPLIERYGPCSISSGIRPSATRNPKGSPHGWLNGKGAAVCAAFHDWVNADRPPFHLLADLDNNKDQRYERGISYAGSEFLCLSIKRNSNWRWLRENVRQPGRDKSREVNYNSRECRAKREDGNFSPSQRPDWRRQPGEPIQHTRGVICPRPQHIRVGDYFTLLDLIRNVDAFSHGHVVPNDITKTDHRPFKRVASVLDRAVRRIGRVSVYRGLNRKDSAKGYDWLGGGEMRVEFLTSATDMDTGAFKDHMMEHEFLREIEVFDHGQSLRIEAVVSD